jgi:hypothetical protein
MGTRPQVTRTNWLYVAAPVCADPRTSTAKVKYVRAAYSSRGVAGHGCDKQLGFVFLFCLKTLLLLLCIVLQKSQPFRPAAELHYWGVVLRYKYRVREGLQKAPAAHCQLPAHHTKQHGCAEQPTNL